MFKADADKFAVAVKEAEKDWADITRDNAGLHDGAKLLDPLSETSRDLIKQIDQLYKVAEKLTKKNGSRGRTNPVKALDALRKDAVDQLKKVRYFHRQADWLQEHFPDAELQDVRGLVKLVDKDEIAANEWSLTPGRYVGVAPEEEDEGFNFEETLCDIHIELQGLNEEATALAMQIQKNFEGLGI